MDKQEKKQRINDSIQNTMSSTIGIEITDIDNDFICGKMPVDERTIQPFGLLHGGASAALAETLGSIAGSRRFRTIFASDPPCCATSYFRGRNHHRPKSSHWIGSEEMPKRQRRKLPQLGGSLSQVEKPTKIVD
jgi:uncharacterized protein (TIGR00369 family)